MSAPPSHRPGTVPPRSRTAPAARRLPQRALYEQVAEKLRARILNHSLGAGSWIDEQALAAEFGISRTPLREALKVLAAEGLVTMKLRRGAYVTEVSERDLADVFHLLALLESDAAAMVAQQATAAQIAQLELLHQQLQSAADDRDRFFAANEAFHMKLLELADNRWRVRRAPLRTVRRSLYGHRGGIGWAGAPGEVAAAEQRVGANLADDPRLLASLQGETPHGQRLPRRPIRSPPIRAAVRCGGIRRGGQAARRR